MANLIYSGPSYGMGSTEDTPAQKRQAEQAIKSMQRTLKSWLKFRQRMDRYVAGQVKAPALFRNPGAKPLPPSVVGATLGAERFNDEQDLAETLHALLTECGADASALPVPDISQDPNVAVKLATIAIKGKTPEEVSSNQAQGLAWFVLLIPVAGIVLTISQFIKSKADVAKDKERIRCIESGACTDAGFWLKVGAIAITAWLAWDKFGLREAVEKKKKKLAR